MIKRFTGLLIALIFSISLAPNLLAAERPFSFAVMGDSRDGESIFKKIIQNIQKDPNISFVVHTGDGVSTGIDAQYRHYMELIQPLKNKWHQVNGNHETYSGGSQNYLKYFPQKYYNFTFGNCLFIVLDNALGDSFNDQQYQWLKALLEKEKASYPLIFMFFHAPLFDYTGANKYHIMEGPGRDLLSGLIKKYRVSYVFAGHIHGYARREEDGTVYIITGGAGAPLHMSLIGGAKHHYLKLTVKDNRVTERLFEIKPDPPAAAGH